VKKSPDLGQGKTGSLLNNVTSGSSKAGHVTRAKKIMETVSRRNTGSRQSLSYCEVSANGLRADNSQSSSSDNNEFTDTNHTQIIASVISDIQDALVAENQLSNSSDHDTTINQSTSFSNMDNITVSDGDNDVSAHEIILDVSSSHGSSEAGSPGLLNLSLEAETKRVSNIQLENSPAGESSQANHQQVSVTNNSFTPSLKT
jgi:hypothetical protein